MILSALCACWTPVVARCPRTIAAKSSAVPYADARSATRSINSAEAVWSEASCMLLRGSSDPGGRPGLHEVYGCGSEPIFVCRVPRLTRAGWRRAQEVEVELRRRLASPPGTLR